MPINDSLLAYRTSELRCATTLFQLRYSQGNRLLEIGAGTGHQALQLSQRGFAVEAIDLDCSPYREAKVFPVAAYDGKYLPFGSDTFDVVFSSNVLEHVEDLHTLLPEITRVLKPGGVAVHVMPSPAWRFWSLLTHFPWMAKRSLAIALHRRESPYRELGRPRTEVKGLRHSLASLIPRRHGHSGTLVGELWSYRKQRWISELEASGLQLAADYPGGLFYTGSQLLGARLGLTWRLRLASVFGSAVHVFCFRKQTLDRTRHIGFKPTDIWKLENVD